MNDSLESIVYYAFQTAYQTHHEEMIPKCAKHVSLEYIIDYALFNEWLQIIMENFGKQFYMGLVEKYIQKLTDKHNPIVLSILSEEEQESIFIKLLKSNLLPCNKPQLTYYFQKLKQLNSNDDYRLLIEWEIYKCIEDQKDHNANFYCWLQPLKLHTANTNISLFEALAYRSFDDVMYKNFIYNLFKFQYNHESKGSTIFKGLTDCFHQTTHIISYGNSTILPLELWLLILNNYLQSIILDMNNSYIQFIKNCFRSRKIKRSLH